ncbi:MAG: hypothetical protein M3Z35_01980 [Nitrospirota bacterium]|nr:hypothetical protein [Nitrospirota bacterium]
MLSIFGCVVDSDTITDEQQARVRRYGLWVTIGMMVLCNAIFLGGMWLTGIRLEQLIRIPDIFNPRQDICLRFTWHQVEGDVQPVRLCSEWILLSDPSGETHTLQKETEVVKGGDGKLYFDYGAQVDYRVFIVGAFVVAIIIFGIWLKRYLIRRYRMHLQQQTSSLV